VLFLCINTKQLKIGYIYELLVTSIFVYIFSIWIFWMFIVYD